jgi:uncharacterized membrane protein YfcA
MNVSQAKIFIVGAVLGAIVGAAFLGPIVHLVLIAVVVAGVGLALYRGRRLVLRRPKDEKRLKA